MTTGRYKLQKNCSSSMYNGKVVTKETKTQRERRIGNANLVYIRLSHIGHKNILHLCNRPFSSIEEHDHALVDNHNSVIAEVDLVYDLGDFAYRCSAEYAVSVLRKLNGRRVILWGNHDKPLRQALQRGMIDDLIKSGKVQLIGSSDPRQSTSYMATIEGHDCWLSHYAHRTWPRAFRKAIHCFGHSHGNLSDLYRSTDVGVDNNRFFPVSFATILERMNKVEEFREK